MSGPIVRSGATPEFWANWDQVFGDKKKTAGTKSGKKSGTKASKKTAKKKSSKKK